MTRAYLVGRISGEAGRCRSCWRCRTPTSGVLVDAIMMDEAHGQHPVQLHALVLPRRPGARRRGRRVPARRSCRASRSASCTPCSAAPSRARPSATASCSATCSSQHDHFVHAPGDRGPGDDLLHAALVRRRVQGDPRPLRVSEEHPARGRAGEVRAGVQARPRRPPGRCAGVQAPAVPDRRASPTSCSRSCRAKRPARVHVEGDELVIDHMYIERRMTPLNLYLRSAITRSMPSKRRARLRPGDPRPRGDQHLRRATCCSRTSASRATAA